MNEHEEVVPRFIFEKLQKDYWELYDKYQRSLKQTANNFEEEVLKLRRDNDTLKSSLNFVRAKNIELVEKINFLLDVIKPVERISYEISNKWKFLEECYPNSNE